MTAVSLAEICDFLEAQAPLSLAAEWDNVGLLVGDRGDRVSRIVTCLTITPAVAAEALREGANLIVTHHPLPFRPLQRLTADDPAGAMLLRLVRGGVAIYSPHTAFDSAAAGINQQLAVGLGLTEIAALIQVEGVGDAGTGRIGRFSPAVTLAEAADRLKRFLGLLGLHAVGDAQARIERVAIGCGSGGEFLDAAAGAGCQLLVTGETRLHTCYEAEARGISLLLAGHFASERFGVEQLAAIIAQRFPALSIWPSRDETDPLRWC
ncbi:MAG: Nif3-like dinuclear metal center hexameric protein [Pirellulaceae bacterium]|nr:Nif3-like dinuclear metal center hexameric protein [Pirellulaceae bacterium]